MVKFTDESIAKFKEVQKRHEAGEMLKKAIMSVHCSPGGYYAWKKQEGLTERTSKPKNKQNKFVDIPIVNKKAQVAIVVCDASLLKEVLGGLL